MADQFQLRVYSYLDRMQPQYAAFVGTITQGDLPVEGNLPELTGATLWLNSPPLTREQLRGKVVLVDFWTYSCINCLRALPYVDAAQACQDAMMSASIVKERGLGDLDARAEAAWLAEAERSIKDAAVSFAMLPIQELLDADGYIARLRARGYTVDMRE